VFHRVVTAEYMAYLYVINSACMAVIQTFYMLKVSSAVGLLSA
jgi:hypothetical protein